jgi:hypothetical protein
MTASVPCAVPFARPVFAEKPLDRHRSLPCLVWLPYKQRLPLYIRTPRPPAALQTYPAMPKQTNIKKGHIHSYKSHFQCLEMTSRAQTTNVKWCVQVHDNITFTFIFLPRRPVRSIGIATVVVHRHALQYT